MKKIITIIVIALFAISANAMAEGSKIGVDYVQLNSEIEGVDFDTSAVQFRYLYGAGPNFEVEGFIALGLDDDSYSDSDPFLLGDFTITAKPKTSFGVFAKLHSDPFSGFQVFGKLGLARVEFDLDIDTQNLGSDSESYDDIGLAFGIGGSFNFNETTAIVLEYVILPDVDVEGTDVETEAISLGLQISL